MFMSKVSSLYRQSKSTYLPFEVNLLFSQYETDTGMPESFINFPILSNSS